MNNELIESFEPIFKAIVTTENQLHNIIKNCDSISEIIKTDNKPLQTEWIYMKNSIIELQKTFSELNNDIRTEILNYDYQIQSNNHEVEHRVDNLLSYVNEFKSKFSNLLDRK